MKKTINETEKSKNNFFDDKLRKYLLNILMFNVFFRFKQINKIGKDRRKLLMVQKDVLKIEYIIMTLNKPVNCDRNNVENILECLYKLTENNKRTI